MHILVVDDEHDVQLLFEQRFRKEVKDGRMQMSFAFSGKEALEQLKQNAPDIALILSDINMPGMNGFELVQFVKRDYSAIKVMMITAYGDEDNFNKAKSCGADDFLTKPINFPILKEKLQSITA